MSSGQFGACLFGLWLAANDGLPAVAERYTKANRIIANNSSDQGAFARTAQVSPTASISVWTTVTSPIFSHWDGLRDALQQALADSSNNTYDAAEALVDIMNAYAATDAAAKQVLDFSIESVRDGVVPAPLDSPGSRTKTGDRLIPPYNFADRDHAVGRT